MQNFLMLFCCQFFVVIMLPYFSHSQESSRKDDVIPDELPWYRFEGLDFYIDTRILVDYKKAAKYCNELGGSLPVLDTVGKREFFTFSIPELTRSPYSFFLGLKPIVDDSGTGNGSFLWYSGLEAKYPPTGNKKMTTPLLSSVSWWSDGQPTAAHASHAIIMGSYDVYDRSFKWNVVHSYHDIQGVAMFSCQREAYNLNFLEPPPSLTVKTPKDKSYYLALRQYSSSHLEWHTYLGNETHINYAYYGLPIWTKAFCADVNGKLIILKTKQKQRYIIQALENKDYRLGFHSAFIIGLERKEKPAVDEFVWNDGSSLDLAATDWYKNRFTKAPLQPELSPNGIWNAETAQYKFVQIGGPTPSTINYGFAWYNVIGDTVDETVKTYPICERPEGTITAFPEPNYERVNTGRTLRSNGAYEVWLGMPPPPSPITTTEVDTGTIATSTTTTSTSSDTIASTIANTSATIKTTASNVTNTAKDQSDKTSSAIDGDSTDDKGASEDNNDDADNNMFNDVHVPVRDIVDIFIELEANSNKATVIHIPTIVGSGIGGILFLFIFVKITLCICRARQSLGSSDLDGDERDEHFQLARSRVSFFKIRRLSRYFNAKSELSDPDEEEAGQGFTLEVEKREALRLQMK